MEPRGTSELACAFRRNQKERSLSSERRQCSICEMSSGLELQKDMPFDSCCLDRCGHCSLEELPNWLVLRGTSHKVFVTIECCFGVFWRFPVSFLTVLASIIVFFIVFCDRFGTEMGSIAYGPHLCVSPALFLIRFRVVWQSCGVGSGSLAASGFVFWPC